MLPMSVAAAAPPSSCAAMRRCHMPRTSASASSPRSSSSASWSGECTMTSCRPSSAGYLLGTTRIRQPGPSGAPPAGRRASTSGGVSASLPAQKGQGGAASPRACSRRRDACARAGATIASLPLTGLRRSSPPGVTCRSRRRRRTRPGRAFGPVHRRVRAREGGALVGVVVRHQAAAGRDGDAQAGVLRRGEAGVVDEPHEAAPVDREVVRGGQAADDHELVAAEARGDVHLACVVGDDRGDEADGVVARRVPELVVDLLERVDVHLDDAVPAPQPLEHRELLGERGIQVPSVEQPGRAGRTRRSPTAPGCGRRAPCRRPLELAEDLHAVPASLDLEHGRLDVHGEALAVLALEEHLADRVLLAGVDAVLQGAAGDAERPPVRSVCTRISSSQRWPTTSSAV